MTDEKSTYELVCPVCYTVHDFDSEKDMNIKYQQLIRRILERAEIISENKEAE